jgi:hypothetical protein
MTPDTFEDRLLSELCAVVAAQPTPATVAPGHARRVPRARLILAAGAVAAAGIGVFAAVGGDTAAPAYAVEKQSDGSVTVEIQSLRDAAGLQEKLRAAGIPAVVDYTPMGKMCRQPRARGATRRHSMGMGMGVGKDHAATFTIPRGDVRPGQTLVIMSSVGSSVSSIGATVIDGPVAPCELVDAPQPPAGGGKDAGPGLSTGGETSGATRAGPSTQTSP